MLHRIHMHHCVRLALLRLLIPTDSGWCFILLLPGDPLMSFIVAVIRFDILERIFSHNSKVKKLSVYTLEQFGAIYGIYWCVFFPFLTVT